MFKLVQLRGEIEYLSYQLKISSLWLDIFPYACEKNSLHVFALFEARYNELCGLHEKVVSVPHLNVELQQREVADTTELTCVLQANLFNFIQSIKKPEINQAAMSVLNELQEIEAKWEFVKHQKKQKNYRVFLEYIKRIKKQGEYITFFNQINICQIELNQAFNTLCQDRKNTFALFCAFNAWKKKTLCKKEHVFIVNIRDFYIAKKLGYNGEVDAILKHKLQTDLSQIEQNFLTVKMLSGTDWWQIQRLVYTLSFYQQWLKVLQKLNIDRLQSVEPSYFSRIYSHYSNLTILTMQKTVFFKQCLRENYLLDVAKLLLTMPENSTTLYSALQGTLQDTKNLCLRYERKLMQHTTEYDVGVSDNHLSKGVTDILAYLGYFISELPPYKMISLLTDIAQHEIVECLPGEIAHENLPKELMICFVRPLATLIELGLLSSAEVTSPYLLYCFMTSAISVALSHIETDIYMGSYLDVIMERVFPFIGIDAFNYTRFDALGIVNKLDSISWLLGLGVLLLVNNSARTTTALAYLVATVFTSIVGGLSAHGIERVKNKRLCKVALMMMHGLSYTCGYNLGGYLGEWLFPISKNTSIKCNGLNKSEALQQLGLFKYPKTLKDLKQSFKQQMLIYHPDKQHGENAGQAQDKTVKIREAYECLLEKRF